MTKVVLKIYKSTLSPLLRVLFGPGCRHLPTCSEYAEEAVSKYGIMKGAFLSGKRFFRCHPFSAGGYDPVK